MDDAPNLPAQIHGRPLALSDLKLTTTLRSLLCGAVPAESALTEIRRRPELHAEVRAVTEQLRQVATPCGEEYVRTALQKLILMYGAGESARAQSWWKLYYQSLRDLPAQALEEAVQDYVDAPDSMFMPKPGQLRALAKTRAEPIWQAASRAHRAADAPPQRHRHAEPGHDARIDALNRADRLEREVPMSLRVSTPLSQWPEEYRAKIEEADRLRAGAR